MTDTHRHWSPVSASSACWNASSAVAPRAGTVSVRVAQRRALAAREAERPTVPAYIVEGDDTTVTRLVEQFAENEHRAGLTEPERAAVFQQLAFEGLATIPGHERCCSAALLR